MDKEGIEIMEKIVHWTLIGAKIKLGEAKRQVALHEEFIKNMEEKIEKIKGVDLNGKKR